MKTLENVNVKKILAIGSFLLLVLSVIPMLYVGIYNHPTGDDIYYGVEAHLAWKETGSLWQTIVAALESVGKYYYEWQGTFSALLIMHLQPTVFSEDAYFLTPVIVLGSILLGSGYLWKQIGRFVIPMNKAEMVGTWSIVMLLSIQWVFNIGEGFYWFNGAVYYSAFYGIMLWMFGLLCKFIFEGGWYRIVPAYLLVILIGGSNYITLLFSLIVLVLISGLLLWKRHPEKWYVLFAVLLLGGCLLISAAAPGNSIRQATSMSLPAHKAILYSLWKGVGFIDLWLDAWWIIGAVTLLPFFISIIKRLTWRFAYPLLVVAFLYGLFCAMICPTMYAMANSGPGRAVNVYHYGFILLSYLAYFYGLGWVMQKLATTWELLVSSFRNAWFIVLGCMIVLQLGISYNNGTIRELASVKAISDIVSGTAEAYDAEYDARLEQLQNDSIMDVVFAPFVNQPRTVYVGDLGQDAGFGANQAMARWYGKNSVVVDWGM
ncbi:MAG: hypothetical protein IJ324_08790 [Lachnospiraceae bacterium]|nr:hypothetical protein [Lachnospiraceae bacterium]